MTRASWTLLTLAVLGSVLAQPDPTTFTGDALRRYSIGAPGIRASFIAYGARLTNLWVFDKDEVERDVTLGYDEGEQYVKDTTTIHSYINGVVGRYANRIRNGSFSLDGETYYIPKNSGNLSTLHGGTIGYDQRNWTLLAHTSRSITFVFYDDAYEGFPGHVVNYATYSVSSGPTFTTRLVSIPLTAKTPLMLSNHFYWNLGAFKNQAAQHVYDNTLHLPYSPRYVQVEVNTSTTQVPNGTIASVDGTPYDYTSPKIIGSQIHSIAQGSCGANCTGYNNAYIIDRPRYSAPESTDLVVLSLSSPETGIQMEMRTNQQNIEIFSCNRFNGSIKAKADQQPSHGLGAGNSTYSLHGCLVIEPQGWVDAIHWPQWGQQQYQIYNVDTEPAVNWAQYAFSIVPANASSAIDTPMVGQRSVPA